MTLNVVEVSFPSGKLLSVYYDKTVIFKVENVDFDNLNSSFFSSM